MDGLEKVKAFSSVVAAIVIPVVLAFVGQGYSTAIKERELQGRFVELAVEILRGDPKEQAEGLRSWATDIINRYSGVPMQRDARNALLRNALPVSGSVRMGDVAEVQEMLQAIGLYSGPVDGAEGPALGNAIRRFQQENGLTADGFVGPRTYTEIKRRFEAAKE